MSNQQISFVIPVFNEAESVEELFKKLKEQIPQLKKHQVKEIIFVNDGSTDETLKKLKSIKDPLIKIASFRINLGKAAALNYGFAKSQGEVLITLDGDLQDGPENVSLLLEKINEGFDLVVGWKEKRHDPLTKTLPSKLFNLVVRYFSNAKLHDFNSGLKALKKEVAQEIFLYGELHRFIPVLAAQKGFRVAEVPVVHHERKYGKSKYGFNRAIKGFFDFLTVMFLGTFGQRPLHLFGFLGGTSMLFGIIFAAYLSILRFQGETIGNRPLLILAILLIITGLQMLLSGLIAEMLVSQKIVTQKDLPIDYDS